MEILALVFVLAQAASTVPPALSPGPTPAGTPTHPPTTSKPAPKLGGGFGQKSVASGSARVVVTDDTVSSAKKGGTLTVSGRSAPPVAPAVAPVETPDEEAAWRPRVAGLRKALKAAQADYDRADAMNTVTAFGRLGHEYDTMMAIRDAALSPYRVRMMEIRQELAGLPEECRRTAGCQPGWVR